MLGRIHNLVARAEMVVLRRLVVDVRNDAIELGAECVVRRDVRDAAGLDHTHVFRLAVRAARDVVEWAIVCSVCADAGKGVNTDGPDSTRTCTSRLRAHADTQTHTELV